VSHSVTARYLVIWGRLVLFTAFGPMAPRIRFSVVVPSRNRSLRIPGFLAALSRIDYPSEDWELVFVNNGATDDTKRVFHDSIAQMDLRAAYVEEPRMGSNRARNAGVQTAQHDIIVFTDDDCYPSRDLLRAYRDEYAASHVGFIGGQVRLSDKSDVCLSIQEQLVSEDVTPHSFLRAGLIHGANMSVRREILAQHGMFDPRFGVGGKFLGASEVELLGRLSFAGVRGLYSPRPIVWHDRGSMSRAEIAHRRHNYDVGRGAYYMRMLRNRSAAPTYLKHWGARTLLRMGKGHFRAVIGEFQGALLFLCDRSAHSI
jgi:glycosyltransferase involved in cell wall biosynthesis